MQASCTLEILALGQDSETVTPFAIQTAHHYRVKALHDDRVVLFSNIQKEL